jgi:hypothetical protein
MVRDAERVRVGDAFTCGWGGKLIKTRSRRDGRVAEGGGLLNRYTGQNLYRGFESLSLRQ